jgi:hypothetical protein
MGPVPVLTPFPAPVLATVRPRFRPQFGIYDNHTPSHCGGGQLKGVAKDYLTVSLSIIVAHRLRREVSGAEGHRFKSCQAHQTELARTAGSVESIGFDARG